ncbi:MAG: hypothetical protein CME19_25310 [Gemmatimonadetes bacterium]|nr:hypothetical protein [Gemmatimonadota bacterium]
MTLRQTICVVASLTGITFIGCLYVTSDFLLEGELSSLEQEAVRIRIERSVNAYERGLDDLDRFAIDWSNRPGAIDTATPAIPVLVVMLDERAESCPPVDSAIPPTSIRKDSPISSRKQA